MYNDLRIITVCENYDDYLAKTLPRNVAAIGPRFLARHIVIVTDAKDRATWKIGEYAGCTIVLSSRLHEDGAKFAKGKAINDAIRAIEPTGWVLLLDADIILPSDFKKRIDLESLDRNTLYYALRGQFINGKIRDLEANPFGYFQLFHMTAQSLFDRDPIYPEKSRSAGGDDDRFGLDVFSTENRELLPSTFQVEHLDHGPMKQNWEGRKSPRIDAA